MTPIGRRSSIWSLRLNGAALAWRAQSGLKTICGTLRGSGPAGGDALGAIRRAAMQQHHLRVLGSHPVECGPDAMVIVALDPAGEGDLRRPTAAAARSRRGAARRKSRLSIIAAVVVRRLQPSRPRPRAPSLAGVVLVVFDGGVTHELEGVAALDEGEALGRRGAPSSTADLGTVLLALAVPLVGLVGVEVRFDTVDPAVNTLTTDQSRSGRSGSRRVSLSVATSASKMSAMAPCRRLASGSGRGSGSSSKGRWP